jgi:structure-specific endonuclease subunit SLX1
MTSVESHVHREGRFFGCYLLNSVNPKYKGRTYIGFTVNPNRRIGQHNAGYAKGGAKRTSGKGPWEMALIVHGFPNEISALRFEWAWQNPERSLRLKHILPQRKGKPYSFPFKFGVLCEMLRVGPWCRLPLTIRWLKHEYKLSFPPSKLPPNHMAVEYGLVQIVKNKKSKNSCGEQSAQQLLGSSSPICFMCKKGIDLSQNDLIVNKILLVIKCIHCLATMHTACLARHFLQLQNTGERPQLLPIDGQCPKCDMYMLWGDLVKFRLDGFKRPSELGVVHEEDEGSSDEDTEEFVERDDDTDTEQDVNLCGGGGELCEIDDF